MFVSLQGRFVFLHNPPSGNVKLEGGIVFACEQSTPTYEELHVQVPFNTKLFIPVIFDFRKLHVYECTVLLLYLNDNTYV